MKREHCTEERHPQEALLLRRRSRTGRMAVAAMFAAIICVATMVIHIPSPLGGYANLGDTMVLLAAFLVGPWYGAVAAGIGSMLADIFLGYTQYAVVTLCIKSAMGVSAGLLYARLLGWMGGAATLGRRLAAALTAGLVAEGVMLGGYYLFALLVLRQQGAAWLTVPPNAVQAAVGLAGSTAMLAAVRGLR